MKIKKLLAMITLAAASFALGATLYAQTVSNFPDVPEGIWYEDAANWAADAGLIEGIDGNFEGATDVNRAQLAIIMQRYDEYLTAKMDAMTEETMPEEEPMAETMTLTLNNVSEDQPLSPGLVVVHSSEVDINYEGELAPAELEKLAEVGNPAEFKTLLEGVDGVVAVYETGLIEPGMSEDVEIMETDDTLVVSVITMAVASNDGYALVDSMPLMTGEEATAVNHDAGFEENTELGSGFDGGQPDPEQGEANIDNGTPTEPQANVTVHDQLTSDLLTVSIN
ncbi:hypothetical protein GF340_04335 [Candidatus Peregrinibacteria bacterium]|nr:hypothetical protein [Candidatus Peregrinibacteria bacterium]